GDVLARLICTPNHLPHLLDMAHELRREVVQMVTRAHIGHGHALLRLKQASTEAALAFLQALRREAEADGGNLRIWRRPLAVRERADMWGEPGDGIGLMRRIKAQFDPRNTLNPGRFVG